MPINHIWGMVNPMTAPLRHRTVTQAPVAGLPAQLSTPAVELHAARVLHAMQRFEDLDWTSVRTIRSGRVRSTWATTAAVREALHHLVITGLVEQGSETDTRGATRPRYRLTSLGENFVVHPTRLAQAVRKRANVTFDESFAATLAVCPEGYTLCLVAVTALTVPDTSRIPTPTPEPFF